MSPIFFSQLSSPFSPTPITFKTLTLAADVDRDKRGGSEGVGGEEEKRKEEISMVRLEGEEGATVRV